MLTNRLCSLHTQLVLLLLLVGCRSERVAFQLQPLVFEGKVPLTDSITAKNIVAPNCAVSYLPVSPRATSAAFAIERAHRPKRLRNSSATNTVRHELLLCPYTFQNHVLPQAVVAPKRSVDDPPWGGIMFFLGIAICVAAVIIGFNLGGWLGLGVGIVLYLAGAYLGARGFAGPNKPNSQPPNRDGRP
ncbi:hypothetical protein SAMN04515668_4156 [Hymenobacter arizonensis]|uniref:Uncharacterized protein n=1 Tax=Hymenobacter arizonensis TaxID=1227077 RepID=A0A1I6B4H2_HYMAR|nr:hypothetical protein SAMN04515668_4156 [Hymenobacter arizonensis]